MITTSSSAAAVAAAAAVVSATTPSGRATAAVAAATAANGTAGNRSRPVAGYESPWWAGTIGFFHGIGTGTKAVVNQSAKAVGGLVSAGRWEPGNLIAVNPQTDIGYDSAALPARIGAEAIIAAGTMGASNLGRAGQVLNAVDTAGNIVNGATGVIDVAQNGLTLQNTAQIATGGAAVIQVAGAARSFAKGCPGHSGNCFVAGTQVAVKSAEPAAAIVGANPLDPSRLTKSESGIDAVLMIGTGIVFAIAKSKLKEEEIPQPHQSRPRRRRKSDDEPHEADFDDIGINVNIVNAHRVPLKRRQVPRAQPATRSTGRCHRWMSQALTAAMLLCLAVGGWSGGQALRPSGIASATAPFAANDFKYSTKNIDDIQVGDLVLARDEHGHEIGWKPVFEVYRRTSFHLRHLKFHDSTGVEQELETTDEHPFFVANTNTFVDAGNLRPGSLVRSPDGRLQKLAHSYRVEHPTRFPVFNFQVEDFHTYFVSQARHGTPILVHNAEYVGSAPNSNSRLYDVGLAKDLRKNPISGTQVNHAPQSRQAESLLGEFNVKNKVGNEPAIRLPIEEHDAVSAAQRLRTAPASARDLLADEIRILRQNTNAPNSALQDLIDLSKKRHPYDYLPLHRTNP